MQTIKLTSHDSNQLSLNLSSSAVPSIDDDQLLVKIHAAAINPIDIMLRYGIGKTLLMQSQQVALPIVLGREYAGEVVKIGKHIKNLNVGDKVWGVADLHDRNKLKQGAHAEYIAAQAYECDVFPEHLTYEQAASMPFSFLTVWHVLFHTLKLDRYSIQNKKILIHGASGNVGSLAVQLLKSMQTYIVASCGVQNIDYLKDLDVDEVIDYVDTTCLAQVKDMDILLDLNGAYADEKSLQALNTLSLSDSDKRMISTLSTSVLEKIQGAKNFSILDYMYLLGEYDRTITQQLQMTLPAYVGIVSPLVEQCEQVGLASGMQNFFGNLIHKKMQCLLTNGRHFHYAAFAADKAGLKSLYQLSRQGLLQPRNTITYHYKDYQEAYANYHHNKCKAKTVLLFD